MVYYTADLYGNYVLVALITPIHGNVGDGYAYYPTNIFDAVIASLATLIFVCF